MDVEPTAAALKAEIAAKRERDMKVRAYEADKAKAGNASMITADSVMDDAASAGGANASAMNMTVDADALNALWQRVRYFLNGKDELGNDAEGSTPGRTRFTELCELKGGMQRGGAAGILPFQVVVGNFISSRMQPELTNDEFRAVFKGIEAFHDSAETTVNWRNILQAPVARETQNVFGIFPRIVSQINFNPLLFLAHQSF